MQKKLYRTCYSDEWSGQTVIPSKHNRYLGVEIDDELNWDYHITTKIDICRNLLAIHLANVRHTFGPKPKLVKWVYIQSKLLYACQAWADKMSDKHIKKMQRLDRLTTTATAPNQRSPPQQATLEIMFDIAPIDLLIEQLGAASFLRTKTNLQPYSGTPNGHLKRWGQIVSVSVSSLYSELTM